MRAENFKPGSIPYYRDLEMRARPIYDDLRAILLSHLHGVGLYSEIMHDPGFSDIQLGYAEAITTDYLNWTTQQGNPLQESLSRGVYLSLYIGTILGQELSKPSSWGMNFDKVSEKLADCALYPYMARATNAYMTHRPAMDILLGNCLETLFQQNFPCDTIESILPLGEVAAQMTLIQTEEFLLERQLSAMERGHNFSSFEAQFSD